MSIDTSKMNLFEKSSMGLIEAKTHCCQEQVGAPWGQGCVVPCDLPAKHYVGWPSRGEGPYLMCPAHTDHSVKNRGAVMLRNYRDDDGNPQPVPEMSK